MVFYQSEKKWKVIYMVKLRLKRMGKKHAPYYRIVAADSRSPRDGRIIEEIGTASMLEQLAEECNELGKAALKLARIVRKNNPTPVTEEQAKEKHR